MDPEALLVRARDAIVAGDAPAARQAAVDCVRGGVQPTEVVRRCTDAIREVGRLWEEGELFLPELVAGAQATAAALGAVQPLLGAGQTGGAQPVAVLGTVRGDLHDIGKSLVGTLLAARGFRVVDLGTDVAPEVFAEAAAAHGAALVGVSALLTTTMPGQREVISALVGRGVRSRLRVLVGGAPVTAAWATSIGADGTAPDALAAAELACSLVGMP